MVLLSVTVRVSVSVVTGVAMVGPAAEAPLRAAMAWRRLAAVARGFSLVTVAFVVLALAVAVVASILVRARAAVVAAVEAEVLAPDPGQRAAGAQAQECDRQQCCET